VGGDLRAQRVDVGAGGERRHGKPVREALDDGQCGLADGTGAAQDGDVFH
jgi:hypothetical protein